MQSNSTWSYPGTWALPLGSLQEATITKTTWMIVTRWNLMHGMYAFISGAPTSANTICAWILGTLQGTTDPITNDEQLKETNGMNHRNRHQFSTYLVPCQEPTWCVANMLVVCDIQVALPFVFCCGARQAMIVPCSVSETVADRIPGPQSSSLVTCCALHLRTNIRGNNRFSSAYTKHVVLIINGILQYSLLRACPLVSCKRARILPGVHNSIEFSNCRFLRISLESIERIWVLPEISFAVERFPLPSIRVDSAIWYGFMMMISKRFQYIGLADSHDEFSNSLTTSPSEQQQASTVWLHVSRLCLAPSYIANESFVISFRLGASPWFWLTAPWDCVMSPWKLKTCTLGCLVLYTCMH